jgi:hypothetical protein
MSQQITTIFATPENPQGLRDASEFIKAQGFVENANEYTTWVEYRHPETKEIVHRSAHVTLKKWPEGMNVLAGNIQ